jgi:hypothetical protein
MEDKAKQIKKLDLKQNAIKILINSIYGAFGNKWFYFYNPDIAQSITLQGQDLIKFSIKAVNHYFLEKWHLDSDLHQLLGISQYKINKIESEAAIYTDTDSIYVQFDSAIRSIEGADFTREAALKICIAIDHHRLSKYFDQCFDKYGRVFNTNNRLKFKLENMSEYGIWLKKKNYAIQVAYDPNPAMELTPKEKRKLIIKGLEPVKSSYPIWARQKLIELTKFVLEMGSSLDLERDLIPRLREIQEEFKGLSVDEIAFNFNVRVYDKFIEDIEELKLRKGISIYPRAAAYYNHLLIKTGLVNKYPTIREKEKIKFYYCATNDHGFDVFAYSPETYPAEIAPPIDSGLQFFSLIVEPTNRLLEAMRVGQVDENLKRRVEVVKAKSKKELTEDQLFPLYAVDRESMESVEIDSRFWKIIGNPDADVSEEDFPSYLAEITRFGLNTTIVPKFELDKYLKKLAKKRAEPEPEEVEEDAAD